VPTEYPIDIPVTPKMADRMRKAGWREPVRVIETIEELDALPAGTIVRDVEGNAAQRRPSGGHPFYEAGWYFGVEYVGKVIMLPATVLWEPTL
jgi:hypothetical protein